jgi:hypothetical protein
MNSSIGSSEPDQGTLARAIGVIVSPTATMAAVIRDPRPAVMLFLVALLTALATGLPQFTERGRQATLDMQVQQIEKFEGAPVSPERYQAMQERSHYGAYLTILGAFGALPLFTLFFTSLYWFIFNALLGGTATFKQVLGVNAHAQVISALGAAVSAPVMYSTDSFTTTGPFSLGALAAFAAPGSFLASFLGGIGIFPIWALIVTAVGLGVLYRRRPGGIALFLVAVYLVIVAGFAAILS